MSEHKLPVNYARIDENIAGPVLDSIEIHLRSLGVLYLPGQYSTSSRPPIQRVEITSSATDNQRAYKEQIQRGGPEHYSVSYDVTNQRDSIAFAHRHRVSTKQSNPLSELAPAPWASDGPGGYSDEPRF